MDKTEIKMIEEMAKVITDLEDCEHKACRIECAMPMGCVYHDEDENECWCQYFDNEKKGCYSCKEYAIATELYNANCRIIGEDEILVKKQAYEKFVEEFAKQEEIAHSYEQGYAELLETNHQLQDKLEKAKQEKREILQQLIGNILNT